MRPCASGASSSRPCVRPGTSTPQPISDALAAVHLRLYEASGLAAEDLLGRLAELYDDLAEDPFLDVPDAYGDLLGDEGIDEFWDQVGE